MESGGHQDAGHASMLELFRIEVETHAAAIQEGLHALINTTESTEHVDALLQAVRSIRGGARIIDRHAAVDIAGALEQCFGTIQKTSGIPEHDDIQVFHKSLQLLREIAHTDNEAIAEWAESNQSRITEMLDTLNAFCPKELHAPGSAIPSNSSEESTEILNGLPAAFSPPVLPQEQGPARSFLAGLTDESMLDLFRAEIEAHTTVLTEELLALEENASAVDQLEALMRAAHSIKGGARVVELDAVVQIAHVMEDCFVAAQRNQLILTSDHIDILFQGVDMLTQISRNTGDGMTIWLQDHQEEILHITAAIDSILSGEPEQASSASDTQPTTSGPASLPSEPVSRISPAPGTPSLLASTQVPSVQDPEKSPPSASSEERDRMIRVTANKIERLMGLGGEVVVSARWLPQFSESLLSLKKVHNDLFGLLEKLQDLLSDNEEFRPARHLVFQIREKTRECSLSLADRLNQLDMFTSTSANLSDRLYHEVIGVRMRPFADGVQRFPRMVRDLAKQLRKKVRLEILGNATDVDRDILEKLDAPLTHLIRNAIDHGIETPAERLAKGKPETGILRLEAVHRSGMLMITFSDDGRGIDHVKLRQQILDKDMANSAIVDGLTETELMEFLFLPGFSTSEKITEISGRGVGLDVVHDMVHEVGGVIRAVSAPDKGVSFQLELPLTLSVIRTFLVEVAGESYAFPLARIDHCLIVEEHDLETVEERQYFHFDKTNIALVDIHDILEIDEATAHTQGLPVVVISDRSHVYGVVVDKFVGECDLVVRPIDSRLGKVPDISAVAVLLDGAPVLIFDVDDMLRSVDKLVNIKRLRRVKEGRNKPESAPQVRRVLIVDDSITVREMERKILENHGYHVEVAVDGMDGWNAVRTEQFDLVVSDVDMPRMNGIELVTHIKQHDELQSVPVMIISYKDTEEHRLQGLEAGANYYLTKSSFQDDSFINAVIDLIGEAS